MARLFAQPQQNYNWKTEQPSLRIYRYWLEWKSDNYGIKETSSIQTSRQEKTWNRLVPHPHVVDKNLGWTSWERGVQAPHLPSQPRVPVPGRWILTTSGCKNLQGLSWWKKLLEPQAVPLKEPLHWLTYSDSLPLGSGYGVVAWGAPVACRGRLRCLASRQAEASVPFLGPLPTGPTDYRGI